MSEAKAWNTPAGCEHEPHYRSDGGSYVFVCQELECRTKSPAYRARIAFEFVDEVKRATGGNTWQKVNTVLLRWFERARGEAAGVSTDLSYWRALLAACRAKHAQDAAPDTTLAYVEIPADDFEAILDRVKP